MNLIHRNWIAVFLALCLAGLPNVSQAAKRKGKTSRTARKLRKELTGISLFEYSARKGDKTAQYDLGIKYLNGDGVPKDYSQSLLWLKKSAGQGFPEADYNLGLIYFNGWGVPKDPKEAAQWFRKSSRSGVSQAQSFLRGLLESGSVPPDESDLKDLKDLANRGDAQAQYIIGSFYYKGNGVQKDLEEAETWLIKAAESGNVNAQNTMDQIGGMKWNLVRAKGWLKEAGAIMAPEKVSSLKGSAVRAVSKFLPSGIVETLRFFWKIFGLYVVSLPVAWLIWFFPVRVFSKPLYRSFFLALLFTPAIYPESVSTRYGFISGGMVPWSCFFLFDGQLNLWDFCIYSLVPLATVWILSWIFIVHRNRRNAPPKPIFQIPP